MQLISSYETELLAWLGDGTLSRLDTAFSRDLAQKIYVQDRMRENAEDLWRWLQDGAHFYVCGDATRMARDVDTMLRRIAMTEGRMNEFAGARLDRRAGPSGSLPARRLLNVRGLPACVTVPQVNCSRMQTPARRATGVVSAPAQIGPLALAWRGAFVLILAYLR